jgi:Ca2+-binding EF-hand superfamily protein
LNKVKKRIKLKHARKRTEVAKKKRNRTRSLFELNIKSNIKGKVQSHGLKQLIIKEQLPDEMDIINEAKAEEDEEKFSDLSDHQSERISILDLALIINQKVTDLPKSFNKFAKKNKQGKGFMNVFSFDSFMGVELGLKLTSSNKRGLFTVIDWNDDGYCSEKEFRKVLATSQEDIQKAIKDPFNYKDGLILDFVVEQIYHDIILFKQSSLDEITEKQNSDGYISIERLTKYLGFYN